MKPKNAEMLQDFTLYCLLNPEQRFWQALRNWSGAQFLMALNGKHMTDTFYLKDNKGLRFEDPS